MLMPIMAWLTGAKASMKTPGRMPATRHRAARMYMAASEKRSVSCADFAASVRARPRKLTPKALTKQAAARAADSASSAPTAGTRNFSPHDGSCGLSRIAWKVSHSDAKPLSGGSAEIATQPTRKTKATCGMRWIRPPRCSMSRSPGGVGPAPAKKKKRPLKKRRFKHRKKPGGEGDRGTARKPVAFEGGRE